MDNSKQNPNPNSLPPPEEVKEEEVRSTDEGEDESEAENPSESHLSESPSRPSRRPFTSLSQIDADLALARTLQEQERAYMMLRMGGAEAVDYSDEGSEYELEYVDGADVNHEHLDENGSVEESDYEEGVEGEEEDDDDVDAFDAQEDGDVEIDPSAYPDDEAYARALQEAEEREIAVRLMALTGIHDWVREEREDHRSTSQDTWQDVDPDDFSYEELVALGEAVGTESRGLSANVIASLPSISYTNKAGQEDNNDQCVICRLDYEDGDTLSILPCKHMYHNECIDKWLQINKVCPVCSVEVSGPSASKG